MCLQKLGSQRNENESDKRSNNKLLKICTRKNKWKIWNFSLEFECLDVKSFILLCLSHLFISRNKFVDIYCCQGWFRVVVRINFELKIIPTTHVSTNVKDVSIHLIKVSEWSNTNVSIHIPMYWYISKSCNDTLKQCINTCLSFVIWLLTCNVLIVRPLVSILSHQNALKTF